MESLTDQEVLKLLDYGQEIDLIYQGMAYLLTKVKDQILLTSLEEDEQVFTSFDDFKERATLKGSSLQEVWGDIVFY